MLEKPKPPKLDARSREDFYEQAKTYAKVFTKNWTAYWPANERSDDAGLVMFRLFADLGLNLTENLNLTPRQRNLAFLAFLAIDPRVPIPAQTVLSFFHAEGNPSVSVPKGSEVEHQTPVEDSREQAAAELGSETPEIIFQTTGDLRVVPATFDAAYFVRPDQGWYRDETQALLDPDRKVVLFGDQKREEGLEHLFLIGDPGLFGPGSQQMTLTLYGTNLLPAYFDLWWNGSGTPLSVRLEPGSHGKSLTVRFLEWVADRRFPLETAIDNMLKTQSGDEEDAEETEETEEDVDEESQTGDYWLGVGPMNGLPIVSNEAQSLPAVDRIECMLAAEGLQAEAAFFNDIELDMKNGAEPFGDTPKEEDAFYIGSDAVFSKTGAPVHIELEIKDLDPPPDKPITAQLAWDFWNGDRWEPFLGSEANRQKYGFVDNTNNFTHQNPSGGTYVRFTCPQMPLLEIGGVANRWIRARIASGNYGQGFNYESVNSQGIVDKIPDKYLSPDKKKALIEELEADKDFSFGYVVENDEYYPPFIKAMFLSYAYRAMPEYAVIHDNFETANLVSLPYQPLPGETPSFQFGFQTAGFGTYTVGNELQLFFLLEEWHRDFLSRNEKASDIRWFYFTGNRWEPLVVADGTYGLSMPGIVGFHVPATMKPGVLFGREAYWFKFEDFNSDRIRPIVVHGIFPNSVGAVNAKDVSEEILGSGNGDPNQSFSISQPLILAGQVVQVGEPSFPSKEEATEILLGLSLSEPIPTGHEAILELLTKLGYLRVANDPVTGVRKIWVRWTEVPNFALSGSKSRHYTLNHETGLVTFGDGVNGMVAPLGVENILAYRYQSSLGPVANVAAETLTAIQADFPEVAGVTNFMPAFGGVSGDDNRATLAWGPYEVQNRNRAVTRENFSQLAVMADPKITRATTVSGFGARIRVYILVVGDEPRPMPTMLLTTRVADYLRRRALVSLGPRIEVNPPDYLAMDVVTMVESDLEMRQLQDRINRVLTAFFNPNSGGVSGGGWAFGAVISVSEVAACVRAVPDISAVSFLSVRGETTVAILGPSQLPYMGRLNIFKSET